MRKIRSHSNNKNFENREAYDSINFSNYKFIIAKFENFFSF